MNITVKLTNAEAVTLFSPVIASKMDGAHIGCPEVSVEIVPANPPAYIPPDVQSRLSYLRGAFTRQPGQYHNKIAMIKEIRTLTGWGLRDSNDFVETILSALEV